MYPSALKCVVNYIKLRLSLYNLNMLLNKNKYLTYCYVYLYYIVHRFAVDLFNNVWYPVTCELLFGEVKDVNTETKCLII